MMLRRWFFTHPLKRKRRVAYSAMKSIRFELLEQRTCMANDFAIAMEATALQDDEVICLVPPTYEAFTVDIELCIDPSVGPRPQSDAGTRSLWTGHSDLLTLNSNRFAGDFADRISWAQNSLASKSLVIRPQVVDVPQVVVAEFDEPSPVPTMTGESEPQVVASPVPQGQGGSGGRETVIRPASYVAAIDWIHGEASAEIVGYAAEADNDSFIEESEGESSLVAKHEMPTPRYGWTGLQAYHTSGSIDSMSDSTVTEANSIASLVAPRPLIAVLPGMETHMETHSEAAAESTVDNLQANLLPAHPTEPAVDQLAAFPHQAYLSNSVIESSLATNPEMPVTEAAALSLVAVLPSDAELPTSSDAARPSRFWYLAALIGFLARPRRVRERLPVVPRLTRC